ncbi:2-hydroxyacid dehydrogenase [Domibacillus robiginosus]|uniref:2-hydroxyacid dehydrogenase n=1 Tax=Domibacillus robiginosus TaxID=1071054 RepID=UPI00067D90F6|nr:D-glycerate dehydrogenase [Domibacillus robiginosus]
MKPSIIVYKKVQQEIKNKLEQDCSVTYFEQPDYEKDPLFWKHLQKAEGLLGSGLRIDEDFLKKAPCLKIISNSSVGYDNLDLKAMTNRQVMGTNTPGVLTDTTADTIFGLLMSAARKMPQMHTLVQSGQWQQKITESSFGVDVHHKVLGIIGMGRIGNAIARRAHLGFGMEILYHNRSRNEQAEKDYRAQYCEQEELLRRSDFVCLMQPLTPETKHSFGREQFQQMKKTAVLIVGSRGGIVKEEELADALKHGIIGGAGLDVFEQEPIRKDHPLLGCSNVVTFPHIGSATLETRLEMDRLASDNLLKGLKGEVPPNLLNPRNEKVIVS